MREIDSLPGRTKNQIVPSIDSAKQETPVKDLN